MTKPYYAEWYDWVHLERKEFDTEQEALDFAEEKFNRTGTTVTVKGVIKVFKRDRI